jgi:ABC-2 type transport system permease protein
MTIRPLLIGLREIKSFFADLGALAFSLALPLVLVALMLAAFGDEVTFSGAAYMVDHDEGPYAEQLLKGLRSIEGLSVTVLDEDEAEDRIDRSAILMYTVIPGGFSDSIEAGEPVELIQYQRGGGGQEGQIVSSMIRGALQNLTAVRELRAETARLLDVLGVEISDAELDARSQSAAEEMATDPAVAVETVYLDDEEPPPLAASLFPRIASWMVLFSVAIAAQSFILERRSGTLERLLTTRLTHNELFIGKWMAYFFRGLIQFVVLFAIAGVVFDFFTLRSWVHAILFGLAVTAAVSSLGLVIATLARTENQGTWGAVFFTMAMAVFGGTFFETGAEDVFGLLSNFTITYWMNRGFDELLIDRSGLGAIATPVLIMLGVTVAGLVVSRMLFRPLQEGAS